MQFDGIDGTLLPKIWLERIQKYWETEIPKDLPKAEEGKATEFDNKLSAEDKAAVSTLVENTKSEDSPVVKAAPKNTYVKDVVSTYNVTATKGDTTNILLSPNKVNDNANVVALYKDGKDWKAATDVSVKNGYVYGTIPTVSTDTTKDTNTDNTSTSIITPTPAEGTNTDSTHTSTATPTEGTSTDKANTSTTTATPTEGTNVDATHTSTTTPTPAKGEVTKAASKNPVTYVVAVFEVKKDIEEVTTITSKDASSLYACNGNPVTILDNKNGGVVLTNKNSGKQITLKTGASVFGGSLDGTEIDSTSIYVKAKNDPKISIYAGSSWNGDNPVYAKSIEAVVDDSIIHSVVGSDGKVRTNDLTITVSNSTVNNTIGANNSYSTIYGVYANVNVVTEATPENYHKLGLGANSWTKKSVITLKNVINSQIVCSGTASGYSYTDDATLTIDGGKFTCIVAGGSNGATAKSTLNIKNITTDALQVTNKGLVGSADVTISDSKIAMIFADCNETDKSATGTVDGPINIEINAPKEIGSDSYLIYAGTNGGVVLTKDLADKLINKIKVSRNTNYRIADDSKDILIDKIVVK